MRHYLLTRSAYGPDVPLEYNRARLDLLRGVTVRSLAAQTDKSATWFVLIDPRDPLLAERTTVLESAGLPLLLAPAAELDRSNVKDRPQGPWRQHIEHSGPVLTTRIDDDDAFAPWVMARFRAMGEARERRHGSRIVWVLGVGWRITHGMVALRRDSVAQFSSLYAPRRDHATIMDINHTSVRRLGRIEYVSQTPAWLWLRHVWTRSARSREDGYQGETVGPVTPEIRSAFPVDWPLIEGLA